MLKKASLIVLGGILGVMFFNGCSAVVAAKVSDFRYTMYFSTSDFDIGPVITTEIPYDASNPNIYELLLNKAIADNKCDTIVFPRYEVIKKTFGRDKIRLTGRVATYRRR
ncbi:hypothetical protein ACFOPX_02240 [Helicobacter baculiformis]|uniref:Lipoprotein n=1 Tax=Helicobacter baculiformis TaxID=427351 RepID=A0ABV7ZJB4_9HELI|nr:hypothetical protein [Helicobacter baculiformis]